MNLLIFNNNLEFKKHHYKLTQNIINTWVLNICMKNLIYLQFKKVKIYSLFVLNKILITIIIIHF